MIDLSKLPHEDHCNLVAHADCCPGKAEFGCSCITAEVVEAVERSEAEEILADLVRHGPGYDGFGNVARETAWERARTHVRSHALDELSRLGQELGELPTHCGCGRRLPCRHCEET